ncbi:MAG: diguanylate cyclase [Campylobacterota bacterium]|nr:diguanylate cyclase [Campylobacterota bacterium]
MLADNPTILIVDDTETYIDVLLNLLDEYDITVAIDGPMALEIANEEKIDLILLDIMMPEMDGYEVCEALKKSSKTKDIPVIFITAKTDEESIEKAYDIGGIDFVTKPFKPKELLARVKRELKLKSLLEHLEFIASHDVMTGIYNRRKFFELGEMKFQNNDDDLYAIMIDIDKFKIINDTYGHPVGDKVIIAVAQMIAKVISKDTLFGRIGGEEFALLYHAASDEALMQIIENIRQSIEGIEVFTDDNHCVACTISAGVAKTSHNTQAKLDDLLKLADLALYEAKGKGRNRSVFRS